MRGGQAQHLCAFARRLRQQSIVVIAPRLYRRLLGDEGGLPLGDGVWGETLIELPREERSRVSFRNVFDGAQLQPVRQGESVGLLAAQALAEFPVALVAAGCETPDDAAG